MKRRIFRSTILVALAVLIASYAVITSFLYDHFGEMLERQMEDSLSLASEGVACAGLTYLENLSYDDFRLTWVAENGEVLFDSEAEEDAMENHRNREEVREALSGGEGEDRRYSSTVMEETLYYARRLEDATVLRISMSRASSLVLLLGMLWPIALVILLAAALSAWLAHHEARTITEPLNKLNLDHPLENQVYEELHPLLERIAQQHQQIDETLQELRRRKREFEESISGMKEGLVLFNEAGEILSVNPAAQQILGMDEQAVGQAFRAWESQKDVVRAMEECAQRGHGETRCVRNETEYQYDFSRIEADGQLVGTVLLIFDVTEQAQLERTRREFTANVSHELKTPLQSIMGSAELMESGMVQAEDLPRFVERIRTESARLVTLIEDIIRLSQMDTGMAFPVEDVDLLELSQEAAAATDRAAREKDIRMTVEGKPAVIVGVPQFLFELVYNLCDNAVKYNRVHGAVRVSIRETEQEVLLSVSDTGIGVPREHLPRIFERFYRVDKSHSRQSGGTGLGLSIVKHAAACHHAKVRMESEVGKGTVVTVAFPKGSGRQQERPGGLPEA